VEGAKLVREALAAGLHVEAVRCSRAALAAEEPLLRLLVGVPGGVVDEEVVRGLSDTRSGTTLIALCTRPEPAAMGGEGLWVVLDGIQDPGNVGTLIRSAWAFGAEGAVVAAGSADPWGPKALRASAGASFHLPLVQVERWTELVRRDDMVLLAEAHAGVEPEAVPTMQEGGRTLLVLGSEGHGVQSRPEGAIPVHLPLRRGAESLNVAAAGAVLLYLLAGRHARPS
jgi:TrmH family RNA methyltransferase